ncbi:MAG: hypothetical protein KGK03_07970 [Candidatus Omnitrophica bacterium]|nr:hypothetical protein [Candidatus Omnitrophota bacterium]MDE2222992.1 hypothetical protein [Candidatus Omnitrophota bacterium]
MSNKLKIIYVCLFIPFVILMVLTFFKIKHFQEYNRKVVLAKDIRKVLESLFLDLSENRNDALLKTPVDGRWHGDPEYIIKEGNLFHINGKTRFLVADHIAALRVRRLKQSPNILEIRIEAKSDVTLVSNLRIRIH